MTRPGRFSPDPEVVLEAINAVKSGVSQREAGRIAGVTAPTVKRWLEHHEEDPSWPAVDGTEPTKESDPEPIPETPFEDLGDVVAHTKAMIARMMRSADEAQRVGNHTAAQRYMRDAAGQTILLARLEKSATEDADVLRISKREIDDAMSSVRERVRILSARPLLCADCSRKLQIALAESDDE